MLVAGDRGGGASIRLIGSRYLPTSEGLPEACRLTALWNLLRRGLDADPVAVAVVRLVAIIVA
jgi:hypothetical protein